MTQSPCRASFFYDFLLGNKDFDRLPGNQRWRSKAPANRNWIDCAEIRFRNIFDLFRLQPVQTGNLFNNILVIAGDV